MPCWRAVEPPGVVAHSVQLREPDVVGSRKRRIIADGIVETFGSMTHMHLIVV